MLFCLFGRKSSLRPAGPQHPGTLITGVLGTSTFQLYYIALQQCSQPRCIFFLQDLIDDWKAKETKRGNGKTIDPTALKWTPPKGTQRSFLSHSKPKTPHKQVLLCTLACSQTLSLNPHTHSCTKRFQQLQHSQSLTESAVPLGSAVTVMARENDVSPTKTLAHTKLKEIEANVHESEANTEINIRNVQNLAICSQCVSSGSAKFDQVVVRVAIKG